MKHTNLHLQLHCKLFSVCVDTLGSDLMLEPTDNCLAFKDYCNLHSAAPFIKDFMALCPRTCGNCEL